MYFFFILSANIQVPVPTNVKSTNNIKDKKLAYQNKLAIGSKCHILNKE